MGFQKWTSVPILCTLFLDICDGLAMKIPSIRKPCTYSLTNQNLCPNILLGSELDFLSQHYLDKRSAAETNFSKQKKVFSYPFNTKNLPCELDHDISLGAIIIGNSPWNFSSAHACRNYFKFTGDKGYTNSVRGDICQPQCKFGAPPENYCEAKLNFINSEEEEDNEFLISLSLLSSKSLANKNPKDLSTEFVNCNIQPKSLQLVFVVPTENSCLLRVQQYLINQEEKCNPIPSTAQLLGSFCQDYACEERNSIARNILKTMGFKVEHIFGKYIQEDITAAEKAATNVIIGRYNRDLRFDTKHEYNRNAPSGQVLVTSYTGALVMLTLVFIVTTACLCCFKYYCQKIPVRRSSRGVTQVNSNTAEDPTRGYDRPSRYVVPRWGVPKPETTESFNGLGTNKAPLNRPKPFLKTYNHPNCILANMSNDRRSYLTTTKTDSESGGNFHETI